MPLLLALQKQRRPTVGQSIVVQTEEEKKLNKMLRKFQKKESWKIWRKRNEKAEALLRSRLVHCSGKLTSNNQSILMSLIPLQRQSSLQHLCVVTRWSYQLDSRGMTKRWEEMKIPAPSKPPDHVVEKHKLIQIKDLDQVGQIGFAGMERLNQIQSIVYETAYSSNENCWVCTYWSWLRRT